MSLYGTAANIYNILLQWTRYANMQPALELHSRAVPSVEAHHPSVGPDTWINSWGRGIKKVGMHKETNTDNNIWNNQKTEKNIPHLEKIPRKREFDKFILLESDGLTGPILTKELALL